MQYFLWCHLLNQQTVVMNDVAIEQYSLIDINNPADRKLAGLNVCDGFILSNKYIQLEKNTDSL